MTKPLSTEEKARRAATRKKSALTADPVLVRVNPTSKADKVRAAFLANPAERPSVVAKATGVDPAYVWDIREVMRKKGTIPREPQPAKAKRRRSYAQRVRALEAEGMTTSDAQAAVDAEDL